MEKKAAAFISFLIYLLQVGTASEFVRVNGLHFSVNGNSFFANGVNAYWLMSVAGDPEGRSKVSMALQEASSHGLTVCRTWAFSDGGYRALQVSPGVYDEDVFRSLDFVMAEARRYGIKLVLSFVNNYESFGGKKKYVEWARERGRSLNSDDEFFSDSLSREFYKNHVTAVITRKNTITGMMYRDDPTIMAWELMNEPRCESDPTGRTLQGWIEEMAAHVKSLDGNHLLEVGLEGFYGTAVPPQKRFMSGLDVGADFIANNLVRGVDFATVHCYPDEWLPGSDDQTKLAFTKRWLAAHLSDAERLLQKPLLIAEFGKSRKAAGFTATARDVLFSIVYSTVYSSAKAGGAAAGSLFWLLLEPGMEIYHDGYEIVFPDIPSSTASIISEQARRLRTLRTLPT